MKLASNPIEVLRLIGGSKQDNENCMIWAFGIDWKIKSLRHIWPDWNQRHGDLFLIRGEDRIFDCMKKIYRAYCETVRDKK